jgi:SAM-dependent methyltransferase
MDLRSTLRPALRPVLHALRPVARDVRRWLRGLPQVGRVDFGDLRRTAPLCPDYGHDRGLPIDRVYIEAFLAQHQQDVRGRVLEIGENTYTRRFGGARVTHSDVLDIKTNNDQATIVADLTNAPQLAADQYDAIILTQTLQLIFDVPTAIGTLHRILKPGGVLLVTVCGVSSIGSFGGDASAWCWGFTPLSLNRLLSLRFGPESVETRGHGNVLAAISFLEGVAAHELTSEELAVRDVDYPIVVSARAIKAASDPR